MSADVEALLRRAREPSPNRRTLREIIPFLPPDEQELDRLLARLCREQDPEAFTNIFVAAMAAGRKPSAHHLIEGAQLLLNPSPLGVAVHHTSGDLGSAMVAAVRRGQMGSEREAVALVAAAAWGQRQNPPIIPPDLVSFARLLTRRERLNIWVQQGMMTVVHITQDPGLRSVVTEVNGSIPSHAADAFVQALIDPAKTDPLAHWHDSVEHTVSSGYTMRRAVERVGRNDPCPCGSGKKYKKCCHEKDQKRLHQSSEIAGVTQEELRTSPEPYLSERRIEDMRAHELAKLDPLKIPEDLHSLVLERMRIFEQHDLAVGLLEKIGFREDLASSSEQLLMSLLQHWNQGLLQRFLAVVPADLVPEDLNAQTRLVLAPDPGRQLEVLQEEILKALKSPTPVQEFDHLVGVAYALLEGPLAPLGILVTRGLVAHINPFDAWGLVETLNEARDRLNLAPEDPCDDQMDALFSEEDHDGLKSSEALNSALERLEEKSEEIRRLRESLEKLQSDLNQRTTPAATPPTAPALSTIPTPPVRFSSTTTPPAEEAVLRELRQKVSALRSALTERHSERNELRKELQATREALESLRSEPSEEHHAVEASSAEQDAETEWEPEVQFTTQPVRISEFPRRFQETLRTFPRGVARACIVLVGRLAAGEAAAFRGITRLRSDRNIWRQRVGADHRLLLRLHPETLEVLDLINRRDLERRIKTLGG
ncbi:MAG: SEC-C domain-containing protein [Verrucomicrobiales bacterium]|nr:SEC-C domain-containing protein [Verrucomicrobiales bacterium]